MELTFRGASRSVILLSAMFVVAVLNGRHYVSQNIAINTT